MVCQATVVKERKVHLSKYPVHFLEQNEGVNMISLHIYVLKCVIYIYTYLECVDIYAHICIYAHCDMYIIYG